jgi:2-(3-amino-3-carboxypropyl)histidine synthase
LTVVIDEERMHELIGESGAKKIVLNAPDGLLSAVRNSARRLESAHPGVRTILIADATYGSCDTVDRDAQMLGADLAFHVGHNVTVPKFGKITYQIDAYDDVSFESVVAVAAEQFKKMGYEKICLVTFAQHLKSLNQVSESFKRAGIDVVVGKGLGQLHDGQIFGCEFYPAFNSKDKADAMVLMGSSAFHGIGLRLSTGKPTFMLDPYSDEVVDMGKIADERLKKAILSIYKAQDADSFGVIIGLKEGQMMVDQSLKIMEKLESHGKKVQLIALREITSARLDELAGIDAFIQTGCPRISVDGYTFSKPVLSVPQAEELIRLLSGQTVDADLFVRKNWL